MLNAQRKLQIDPRTPAQSRHARSVVDAMHTAVLPKTVPDILDV